jgi:hypothetical protein
MVYSYNFNTSSNRFSYPRKHPLLKTNPRIPFSHSFAWIVSPSDTKIKQTKFFRKVYIGMGAQHLFYNVLWIVAK